MQAEKPSVDINPILKDTYAKCSCDDKGCRKCKMNKLKDLLGK